MKTLKELNEKAWYRLIKVIYIFLYLPSLLVLYLAYDAGKDYHWIHYPNTVKEALDDADFYKLSDDEKRQVLSILDSDFKNLPYDEQTKGIEDINKRHIPQKGILQDAREEMGEKYVYTEHYTRNVKKTIMFILIATLCYVLFMEIIRRAFYYVAIGKLFPKE